MSNDGNVFKTDLDVTNVSKFITYKSMFQGTMCFKTFTCSKFGMSCSTSITKTNYIKRHRSKATEPTIDIDVLQSLGAAGGFRDNDDSSDGEYSSDDEKTVKPSAAGNESGSDSDQGSFDPATVKVADDAAGDTSDGEDIMESAKPKKKSKKEKATVDEKTPDEPVKTDEPDEPADEPEDKKTKEAKKDKAKKTKKSKSGLPMRVRLKLFRSKPNSIWRI